MKQLNSKQFAQIPGAGNDTVQVGQFTINYSADRKTEKISKTTEEFTAEQTTQLINSIPNGTAWYSDGESACEYYEDSGFDYQYPTYVMLKFRDKFVQTVNTSPHQAALIKPSNQGGYDPKTAELLVEWGDYLGGYKFNYPTGRLGKPIPTVVSHFLTLDTKDIIVLWNTTAAALNTEEANKLLKKCHFALVIDQTGLGEKTNPTDRFMYTEFDTITVIKDEYFTTEITSKRAIANDAEWKLAINVDTTEDGNKIYSLPALHCADWKDTPIYHIMATIKDKDNYCYGINDGYYDDDPTTTDNFSDEGNRMWEDHWEVIE